ncbi:MAG: glycosyltransferase family 1 protein [Nitrospirae bacterium]|nr:MAG: glycosyltransferase family 1 protein [Nitrospirota bacterium]
MSEPPVILFVHGIGEIGGAERELIAIAVELAKRHIRPIVACPPASPLQHALAARHIETRAITFVAWRKWGAILRRHGAVETLRSVLQTVQPALIHVNDIWWVPQTLRAMHDFDRPLVAHIRQQIEPWKVRRYKLDRANVMVAVSEQIRQSVIAAGVDEGHVRTVYSGVDLSGFAEPSNRRVARSRFGFREDHLVLGTVANIFPRKGYELMLKALPQIIRVHPQVQYVIVGAGDESYLAQLKAISRHVGIEAHVHFLGFQQHVPSVLSALDLYVHPAEMEGFGIAILEAMAAGKAVVATSVGGIPEIVRHGETGILVHQRDPDVFARAVIGILNDPERRQTMGQEGHMRIQNYFTTETMMHRLIENYQAVFGAELASPLSSSKMER